MKTPLIYQDIANQLSYDSLPSQWTTGFNLKRFSSDITLYDYQENALKNAINLLSYYYESIYKYSKGETEIDNIDRKKKMFGELWRDNKELFDSLGITNKKSKVFFNKIKEYYSVSNGDGNKERIPFYNFVNRMCFWMATGSGKSLVLVKLIEILEKLKSKKLIPNNDILILTQREDLIEQIKDHIEIYNKDAEAKIKLWDLKDYEEVKKGNKLSFGNDVNIFIYRSDLISDKTTQKNISFEDKENNGEWYILLDEAHKGDKEDSKRQLYYSILSRKGFIFNFSATFTHNWDIVTTAYNFNLDKFITEGYGKNLYLSEQELNAFKNKKDFKDKEKQKIILKSLILLTLTKSSKEKLDNYHNPLMVALVNSVSKKDSDLQIFFKQLEQIALGNLDKQTFEEAKKEISEELNHKKDYVFGNDKLYIDLDYIKNLSLKEVKEKIFYSKSNSKIEILKIPGNQKELIFKLKDTDKPFALSKTGDIYDIVKNLENYEINESIDNSSRFKELNKDNSSINLLMGSRAFYEGWDSNRPNVMVFINIGTGDAKKYVTQSIGRGVRVEPLKNKRKRVKFLNYHGDTEAKEIISNSETEDISQLETLFVFGTNKKNVEEILNSLKEEKEKAGEVIELKKNPEAEKYELIIPKYAKIPELPLENLPKFQGNNKLLNDFVSWIDDERLVFSLLENEGLQINDIKRINEFLRKEDRFEKTNFDFNARTQFDKLFNHLKLKLKKFDKFKTIQDEIIHFKKIRAELNERELNQLKEKIEIVKNSINSEDKEKELDALLEKGKITLSKYKEEIKKIGKSNNQEEFLDLNIKYIANHYYIPVIVSEKDKIKYINHIINVESEREFLKQLEQYLKEENNLFKEFDWWMFSKLDEHTDEISMPYYDKEKNSLENFKPDFIFWLKKGNDYHIIFIDPKGTKYSDYQMKVDGYKYLFANKSGIPKKFHFGKNNVFVSLFLHTKDKEKVAEGYKDYWFDSIDKTLREVLGKKRTVYILGERKEFNYGDNPKLENGKTMISVDNSGESYN